MLIIHKDSTANTITRHWRGNQDRIYLPRHTVYFMSPFAARLANIKSPIAARDQVTAAQQLATRQLLSRGSTYIRAKASWAQKSNPRSPITCALMLLFSN